METGAHVSASHPFQNSCPFSPPPAEQRADPTAPITPPLSGFRSAPPEAGPGVSSPADKDNSPMRPAAPQVPEHKALHSSLMHRILALTCSRKHSKHSVMSLVRPQGGLALDNTVVQELSFCLFSFSQLAPFSWICYRQDPDCPLASRLVPAVAVSLIPEASVARPPGQVLSACWDINHPD